MPYNNPPVTVSALLHRGGKVLVGVRGHEDGRGKLDLVGGFVEVGETLEEALAREVKEETGLTLHSPLYFGSWVGTYSDGRRILACYFLCSAEGEPQPTAELTGFEWITEVPDDLFFDVDRAALRKYFS